MWGRGSGGMSVRRSLFLLHFRRWGQGWNPLKASLVQTTAPLFRMGSIDMTNRWMRPGLIVCDFKVGQGTGGAWLVRQNRRA